MDLNDDPNLFLEAEPLLTKGASPLNSALFSLNYHLPQIYDYNAPIQAVDGAIRDLHRILAMICFYRGTLAPIHGLPDDILTEIFRFNLSGEVEGGFFSRKKLMLVCRRWRSLIMSDGYLWSFINASILWHVHSLQVHIWRSGYWPLTIYHSSPDNASHFYTYSILQQFSARIDSVHFNNAPKSFIVEALQILGEGGLAGLTTLELDYAPRESDSDDSDPIHFHSCDQFPAHMTELKLSHFRSNSVPYDLHQFFQNLSRSPNLEVLKIVHAVENPSPAQPVPSVHLPHLRILSIFGGGDVVTPFLASLIIPRMARVFVSTCTRFENASATSRALIAPLRKYYRDCEGTRIRAVKIENTRSDREGDGIFHNMHIFGLKTKDVKSPGFYFSQDSEKKAMEFNFFCATWKAQTRFTRKMFTSLMTQVEVLDTRSMYAHSSAWWKAALLSLPALTEVYISGDSYACSVFCQTLQKLMDTHPKSFPKLHGVYVCKFTERQVNAVLHGEYGVDIEMHKRNAEALRELVVKLKERGHGLQWLTIDNYDFTYWPGSQETRDIASAVDRFMYHEDQVYDFEDKPKVIPPLPKKVYDGSYTHYY
ncbi:hypothetical protein BDZ89DRAFT_1073072 [Hymenopellis radicata]|nr:hypothetical protein BDZ89DRAFT_1073072 [Hymenopellis radicata]